MIWDFLPNSIQKGDVARSFLFKTSSFEVSVLRMPPRSQILWHKHEIDSELYIHRGGINFCQKGQAHGLINNSRRRYVFSIKFKWFRQNSEASQDSLHYFVFLIFSANSLVIPLICVNSSKLAFFIFSTLPNFFNNSSFFTLPIPFISSNSDLVISLSLNFLW